MKEKKTMNSLRTYYNQIKDKPLLTLQEELDLSRRIHDGDIEALRCLVESNLKLVVKIAKSLKTSDIALLDLIQEGNIGLMKAAEKYDFRKKIRFSTYASWWIKQSIVRALSNKRRTIRLPHRKEEKIRKINNVINMLSQKFMRPPELQEIAQEMRMREDEIIDLLSFSNHVVSLDSENNDVSCSLKDILEDNSYDPDSALMKKSLREETLKHLNKLKEKEREIIKYRYAFYEGKRFTLKTISMQMGISPETVRQIEIKALAKLKDSARDLQDYCYN